MISFKDWADANIDFNSTTQERVNLVRVGWCAALEAILNERDRLTYIVEDGNEVAISVAKRLSEVGPGGYLALTEEEMEEYRKIRVL